MEHTPKEVKSLINKVIKWNKDFQEYVDKTGSNLLPSVDCTCFGYDEVTPYKIKEYKTKFVVIDSDGTKYDIKEYSEDNFPLEEAIRYDRRRLAKAWRIEKSNNPDAEEMKDTEDEDDE